MGFIHACSAIQGLGVQEVIQTADLIMNLELGTIFQSAAAFGLVKDVVSVAVALFSQFQTKTHMILAGVLTGCCKLF